MSKIISESTRLQNVLDFMSKRRRQHVPINDAILSYSNITCTNANNAVRICAWSTGCRNLTSAGPSKFDSMILLSNNFTHFFTSIFYNLNVQKSNQQRIKFNFLYFYYSSKYRQAWFNLFIMFIVVIFRLARVSLFII